MLRIVYVWVSGSWLMRICVLVSATEIVWSAWCAALIVCSGVSMSCLARSGVCLAIVDSVMVWIGSSWAAVSARASFCVSLKKLVQWSSCSLWFICTVVWGAVF